MVEFHFNTSLMFVYLEAIDEMTKDLITDVNIYLTMSCREHIFHDNHGISIDRTEQQPEFNARKSVLITFHVNFDSRHRCDCAEKKNVCPMAKQFFYGKHWTKTQLIHSDQCSHLTRD